jgi:ribonuclease HI
LEFEVYFDGAPKKATIIINSDHLIIRDEFDSSDPVRLEYHAFIKALEQLRTGVKVKVFSDSQAVVSQMNSYQYEPCPSENQGIIEVRKIIQEKKLDLRVLWVPKDKNLAGLLK